MNSITYHLFLKRKYLLFYFILSKDYSINLDKTPYAYPIDLTKE